MVNHNENPFKEKLPSKTSSVPQEPAEEATLKNLVKPNDVKLFLNFGTQEAAEFIVQCQFPDQQMVLKSEKEISMDGTSTAGNLTPNLNQQISQ